MSDVEVVTQIYEAFVTQDVERLFSLVDAECVITQDPSLPWGGRHVGHDGLAQFAAALTGTIDSKVTTESLFEADGQVIQCGRTRGSVVATGASFDVPEVHTWTVKGGKAIAAHFAIDTPAMLEALGRAQ